MPKAKTQSRAKPRPKLSDDVQTRVLGIAVRTGNLATIASCVRVSRAWATCVCVWLAKSSNASVLKKLASKPSSPLAWRTHGACIDRLLATADAIVAKAAADAAAAGESDAVAVTAEETAEAPAELDGTASAARAGIVSHMATNLRRRIATLIVKLIDDNELGAVRSFAAASHEAERALYAAFDARASPPQRNRVLTRLVQNPAHALVHCLTRHSPSPRIERLVDGEAAMKAAQNAAGHLRARLALKALEEKDFRKVLKLLRLSERRMRATVQAPLPDGSVSGAEMGEHARPAPLARPPAPLAPRSFEGARAAAVGTTSGRAVSCAGGKLKFISVLIYYSLF